MSSRGHQQLPSYFLRSFRCLLRVIITLQITLGVAGVGGFEQDQRINGLTLQIGVDSFATVNAFGGAFTNIAQPRIQPLIDARILNGSTSLIFEMPTLADLTGTNESNLRIGVVNGVYVFLPNNPVIYSGTSDLDWWYTPNAGELDGNDLPTKQLIGSIVTKNLNAGPGAIIISPSPLGGGPWAMSAVVIKATIGNSSAPLQSTNTFPPGHRPSENLDPQLVSFTSMSAGQLKGIIPALSLANTPIPASMVGVGPCNQSYTAANTLLDLVVGGCDLFVARFVKSTQPDTVDSSAPVAGAGPPYTFTANPASKVVTGCKDKNGASVALAAGLNAAAYSTYFSFTTDRVIAQSPAKIVVEQPLGTDIHPGGSKSFGGVAVGANASLTFAIRNTGLVDLTGLGITVDGADAAIFTITATPTEPVSGPNGSTVFTVRFAPAGSGAKSAALHIANNDADRNPFDLVLIGTGLTAMDAWRKIWFGTTSNTGAAADNADPNHNGIPNLLEYALGGDPSGNTTGLSVLPQAGRSAGDTLQLSFTRYLDRNDITLTVQGTDSVTGAWTDLARSSAGGSFTVLATGATVNESGAGNARLVTLGDLSQLTDPAHPQRFMRLLVTSP